MDYIKTSELTEKTTLADDDLFEIVDSVAEINKKVKLSTLQNYSRPYKVYKAFITQTGTDAPTVSVLENMLGGTVVWTRVEAGIYRGTLANAFTASKTFIHPIRVLLQYGAPIVDVEVNCVRENANSVLLSVTEVTSGDGVDDFFSGYPVKIEVHN